MAVVLSLLVSLILFKSSFAKIPEVTCSLSDKNFDTCLQEYINKLVPQLANEGIPEIKLAPLDPLVIKEIKLLPNETEVNGRLVLKDIVVKGLLNTTIWSLSSDLKKLVNQTLEMKVGNPKLMISGKYSGSVRLYSMNIHGDGEFRLQLKNIETFGKLVADTLPANDNKNYFIVKSVDVTPNIGSLKVNATHLFQDNLVLSGFVLDMVNNYWRSYYEMMLPTVKPYLDTFITAKINEFTEKVPADQIVKP